MARVLKMFTAGTAVIGIVAYSSCFVVTPGQCAVVYNRFSGVKNAIYTEGLQFRILGLEEPKLFDIRFRPRVLSTETGTKDLQMVNIKLRVLFHPIPERLPDIYRTMGNDYDERLLPSVSNEVLKAVVAEYKAEDLIISRKQVSDRIRELMGKRIREFGIVLEDLSLMDIQFGKEFMAAVEQKQVAQQEAERHKFVVLENEQHMQASIIKAQGEATSAELISKALQKSGDGLIELRKIEAAKEMAQNLTKAANVQFIPAGNSSNLLLNIRN